MNVATTTTTLLLLGRRRCRPLRLQAAAATDVIMNMNNMRSSISNRWFSNKTPPPTTTTTTTMKTRKKITSLTLLAKKRRNSKITMVTAYDYPSALQVDAAGIDMILVGDSCAMVELGHDTTVPITLNEMLHHCKAVSRGAKYPLLVGDMPLGSYEVCNKEALRNAYKFLKESGMDAVKLEGGSVSRAATVKILVEGGVAVLGHVGLTPQSISVLGGFRAQGRTAVQARKVLDDALRLQDSGAFGVVLECVPAPVAQAVTEALEIPTIGIGAGGYTDGQVLVYHDMLGMNTHPHHKAFVPKFCKKYADLGLQIRQGLEEFREDVCSGTFPSQQYSPYHMSDEEQLLFQKLLDEDAYKRIVHKQEISKTLKNSDEYETLGLYGGSNIKKK